MSDRRLIPSNIYVCRLLNRILAEEKRRKVLEANTNVHINNTIRKMQEVDANFEEMEGSSRRHRKAIDSLERKADRQAEFNRRMEAMMLDLQGTVEAQGDRIVELEEELAVLRSKKACKCGETAVAVVGSGSQEDPIELGEEGLEYAGDEGSGSDQSYHTPPRAEEALLVFGSPVSQTLPAEVSETCGCPIPSVIRIEDDVEMVAVPQENAEPLPVRVEPPRYDVGIQRASCGRPLAHYRSSTRHCNRHAKQLGVHPYSHPGYFMDQDLRFPCSRELRAAILSSTNARGSSRSAESSSREVGTEGDVPVNADRGPSSGPSSARADSTGYRPCSSSCGGDCV